MVSEVGSVCRPTCVFRLLSRSILIFRTHGARGLNVSRGTGRLLISMRKREGNRWTCLCIYLEAQGEDVLSSFNLTNEEVENYNAVVARFNTYFNVRTNVIFERAVFNRLNQNDSDSDDFIDCILKPISVVMATCGTRCWEIELLLA